MKNTLLYCCCALIMITMGCRKNADITIDSSWKLGNNIYEVNSISRQNGNYLEAVNNASSTQRNTLRFHFYAFPTAAGAYSIAGKMPYELDPREICVEILKNNTLIYSSSPYNTEKAAATLRNGRVTIDLPAIWMYNAMNSDSIQLTAQITEY